MRNLLFVGLLPVFITLAGCNPFSGGKPSNELIENNIKSQLGSAFDANYEVKSITSNVVSLTGNSISVGFSMEVVSKNNLYTEMDFAEALASVKADLNQLNVASSQYDSLPAENRIGIIPPSVKSRPILVLSVPKGTVSGLTGKISAEKLGDAWQFGPLKNMQSISGETVNGAPRSHYDSDAMVLKEDGQAYLESCKKQIEEFASAVADRKAQIAAQELAKKKEIEQGQKDLVASYHAAAATGKSYKGNFLCFGKTVEVTMKITDQSADSGVIRAIIQSTDPDFLYEVKLVGQIKFGSAFDDPYPLRFASDMPPSNPVGKKVDAAMAKGMNFFLNGGTIKLTLDKDKLIGVGDRFNSISLSPE